MLNAGWGKVELEEKMDKTEIKKIIQEAISYGRNSAGRAFPEYHPNPPSWYEEKFVKEICQQFPKSPDNPDGFKSKPELPRNCQDREDV